MSTRERIVAVFASGTEDLIPTLLDALETIAPGLPLYIVSEFAPPRGRWIPYSVGRTLRQNQKRIADALKDKEVAHGALLLQPGQPYWPMRLLALLTAPRRLLCFNENLDHFALHPRSALAMLRHMLWRGRNLWHWETHPGGWLYTQLWRLRHPGAWRRPVLYRLALRAGHRAAARRTALRAAAPPALSPALPAGVSVVIPSRDGRELLERLFPSLLREFAAVRGEVIVVDNGSDDGTADWLARAHPDVVVEHSAAPLSFARAVNRCIARARYSHTLLLNNDMLLEPGFFPPLLDAFARVPDLFCATAQIFFPAGRRREETGKALLRRNGPAEGFPVWCAEPLEGEDLSYVLYGSGGCSLYDTRKLRACGGMGEVFTPAYVEDLDLGWRAWSRGWPTVFVAGARVLHHHRSTTARYFAEDEIQQAVEINYLRFLARSVADPDVFREFWRRAVWRLNVLAAKDPPAPWVLPALRAARQAPQWVEPAPPPDGRERHALALAAGEAVHFPGRAPSGNGRPLVLIASPYLPFPLSHGGAVRMYNLMRRAAQDFDQVLAAFCDHHEPPAPEILDLCREVVLVRREGSHLRPLTHRPDVVEEHDTPAFHAVLRELIRKHAPALVQLEFTQMALYAADCGGLPTLLVEHDITLDLYAQLLQRHNDWETRQQLTRWIEFEKQAWRGVSCVVAMSDRDLAMIEGARRAVALPNGVDLDRFQPCACEPEPRRILFIGSFAHLPNLMALRFFLDHCWPRLRADGATLHVIAGARPEHYQALYQDRVRVDLVQPGIEAEAFVVDVRDAYSRASVVIAPLLASAGTNIKILEATAMGKAIVSTPAGIHGLDLRPGEDVLVAATAEEFTAAILDVLHDPERRRALGRQARLTAEQGHGWDAVAGRQAALYRSVLA